MMIEQNNIVLKQINNNNIRYIITLPVMNLDDEDTHDLVTKSCKELRKYTKSNIISDFCQNSNINILIYTEWEEVI